MLESHYQAKLIKKIRAMLPGCFVIKNDPMQYQGVPDLLVLFRDRWGMLEVKVDEDSPVEPNQPYYVALFDEMSFAAFIHPGNERMVLNDLQSALGS